MSAALEIEPEEGPCIAEESARWLAGTDLANCHSALVRLSRAMFPARYGFPAREPLVLPSVTTAEGDQVLRLLRAGQVPTVDAIRTESRRAEPSKRHSGPRVTYRAVVESAAGRAAEAGAVLLSEMASAHWIETGVGPTWSEAFASPDFGEWWTAWAGNAAHRTDIRGAFVRWAPGADRPATARRAACGSQRRPGPYSVPDPATRQRRGPSTHAPASEDGPPGNTRRSSACPNPQTAAGTDLPPDGPSPPATQWSTTGAHHPARSAEPSTPRRQFAVHPHCPPLRLRNNTHVPDPVGKRARDAKVTGPQQHHGQHNPRSVK